MYRLTATFKHTQYWLECKGQPNRTLLASDFLWVLDTKPATVLDFDQALKWFTFLAKKNKSFGSLTLERM